MRNPTAAPHCWDSISVTQMLSGLDSSMLAWGTYIRYTMDTLTFVGLLASGHRPSKNQLGVRQRRATSDKLFPGQKVADILKRKNTSIRQARLPQESPDWDTFMQMTWEQIEAGARANRPGLKLVRQL